MKKILSNPARFLTFLFALVFCNSVFSQDDIIMLNNDVIKAKVEEVGVDVIKYRKADNMDGPTYDMRKADVYMIVYANGTRDVINGQPNNGAGDNTPAPADGVNTDVPVRTAPPEIPVYEQPLCPYEGYLWTPGYWAFGLLGYYWVPGVWVRPPQPYYLWTPGWWGYDGGIYAWHGGYWGEHIGFYGGVNYGYGYGGSGYYGGRWEGGVFRYNTAVSRVDVTVVHTTYIDNTVVRNNAVASHASFNGAGGVRAEPTVTERAAMSEKHVTVTPEQQTHIAEAKTDKGQYLSENKGKPAVTAVNKPGGQHFSPEGHQTVAHPNTAVIPKPQQQNKQPVQENKVNNAQEIKKPVQETGQNNMQENKKSALPNTEQQDLHNAHPVSSSSQGGKQSTKAPKAPKAPKPVQRPVHVVAPERHK